MTQKRLISPSGTTYVHIISKAVDGDFKFADPAVKRMFRDILGRAEKFSGVKVHTFDFLDNHFHFLTSIPERPNEIPLWVVRERIMVLYEGKALDEILAEWDRIEEEEGEEGLEAYADTFRKRMYDMGEFMKTCKQRMTMCYNKLMGRSGTLWGERYKSILIQGTPGCLALRILAAYVDLNCVRAGIVDDPARYEFSGYGEACRGDEEAREALMAVFPKIGDGSWKDFDTYYRGFLYDSEEKKRGPQAAKRLEEAMRKGFSLPLILRQSLRVFTDGLVLGDRDFVNQMFNVYRDHFGPKRKDGARSVPFCPEWKGELYAARDLRKRPITLLTG